MPDPSGPQEGTERARAVVVADDDVLFSSRISADLKGLGYRPLVAATDQAVRARLREMPAAAIFNLAARRFDASQAIRDAKLDPVTRAVPLIGFCGHRDAPRQASARAAGCDMVVTNGAVVGGLAALLRSLLAQPRSP